MVLPLDDQGSAVQGIRHGALQTGVAHQVGGLENIGIQTQIPLT